MSARHTHRAVVDVHLVLRRNGKILLAMRRNTGFGDGLYHLPAGHLEGDESVLDAVLREAYEELDIRLAAENVRLVHVMHQASNGGRVGLFFATEVSGEGVRNREPEKCLGLEWFSVNGLPIEMVDYARIALGEIARGSMMSTYGWTGDLAEAS